MKSLRVVALIAAALASVVLTGCEGAAKPGRSGGSIASCCRPPGWIQGTWGLDSYRFTANKIIIAIPNTATTIPDSYDGLDATITESSSTTQYRVSIRVTGAGSLVQRLAPGNSDYTFTKNGENEVKVAARIDGTATTLCYPRNGNVRACRRAR